MIDRIEDTIATPERTARTLMERAAHAGYPLTPEGAMTILDNADRHGGNPYQMLDALLRASGRDPGGPAQDALSRYGLTTKPPRDPHAFPGGFICTAEGKPTKPLYAPDPDPRPVLTLADGSTVRADEVWEGNGDNCEAVARAGDESFGRSCAPGAAWVRLRTMPWQFHGENWKQIRRRVYPPAEAKPDPTAALLAPGDQIRTHTGWHTVTAAEHPAYPHVATESGMWSHGAILETRRKDEAKPTTLAAPPGRDPGGPARNVPIRVGDYVYCGADRKWLHVASVHGEYVTGRCGWSLSFEGITEHRAAPRITLPDGREVTPERMWLSTNEAHGSVAYANVGNCAYCRVRGTSQWNPIGNPWRDEQMTESAERTWPPAECEGT